jgi:hypothetical protein
VARREPGVRAGAVYAALAGALVVAVAVVVGLPRLARPPAVTPQATEPPPPASPLPPTAASAAPPAAPPTIDAAALDAVLARFLAEDKALTPLNPARWAASDWAALREAAAAGDAALKRRDEAAALASYRRAEELATGLRARAPQVRAAALADGEAALAAGDQARATAAFELALAFDAADPAARRGLGRAQRLDQVRELMQRADVAAAAGDRAAATKLYREVLALDDRWQPARTALAALGAAAAQDAYAARMAEGYAAQAGNDVAGARSAFQAALALRPGDAEAQAALSQADADRVTQQLATLRAEALALEAGERWAEALQRHEAALAIDANLAAAREGQARAAARSALDRSLDGYIAGPERFNDDAVVAAARAALAEAQAIPAAGARLRGQVAELERLIAVGTVPVSVRLESDTLTEVTVFKIGRLGTFDARELQLRPGLYTAVGSRPGYRDVRRQFRVTPTGTEPVVVRCEEPI